MKLQDEGQMLIEFGAIFLFIVFVVTATLIVVGPLIGNTFTYIEGGLSGLDAGGGALPAFDRDDDADEALEEARERVEDFREAALEQEESMLEEAPDLFGETLFESAEVIAEYLEETGNEGAAEILSIALEAFAAGNYEESLAALESLNEMVVEIPPEIQVALTLKMTPRLIASCHELSEAIVSGDLAEEALEAVDQVPEAIGDEARPLVLEAQERVDARNQFNADVTEDLAMIIDQLIAHLVATDDPELIEKAAEFEAASEDCGP